MRNLLGGIVFAAGIVLLGLWGRADHARDIEAAITAEAAALPALAQSQHNVEARVSGRDIVVSGLVDNVEERDAIVSGLDAVLGRRLVRDELVVLPETRPYVFEAIKTTEATRYSGVAPTEAVRETLLGRAGAGDLVLSSGMPDSRWPEAVGRGLEALEALIEGTLSVSDRDVVLVGVAENPDARTSALLALSRAPSSYNDTSEIELLDDGTPFRLLVEFDGARAVATGKLPSGIDASLVGATLGVSADVSGVSAAKIAANGETWPRVAYDGVTALSQLDTGTLSIEARSVTLTGIAGSQSARQTAEGLIDSLRSVALTEHDIAFADDGRPFQLVVTYAGTVLEATGKLPAALDPETLSDAFGKDIPVDGLERALINDSEGTWPQMVADLLSALGKLEIGRLEVNGTDVRLTGIADSRAARSEVDRLLAGLPPGTTVEDGITFADDGQPFSLRAEFENGLVRASGKFPANVDLRVLGDSLGRRLPMREINVALIDDPTGDWPRIAESSLDALGKLASGSLQITGTVVELSGIAGSRRAKTDADALIAGLSDIGQATSDVSLADDGLPYTLNVSYTRDGRATASGKLPWGSDGLIADTLRIDTLESEVAIGLLDDERGVWPDLAARGLDAMALLEAGTLEVRGGMLRLIGSAGSRQAKEAAEAQLDDISTAFNGVNTIAEITLEDDGEPFALTVKYAAGAPIIATGKLPGGTDVETLERNLGASLPQSVVIALVDDEERRFQPMMQAAAQAMGRLDTGVMELTETALRLTGMAGSRTAKAEAEALIAALPDGFDIVAEVRLADDGRPFFLDAERGADRVLAAGKLPFGMTRTVATDALGEDTVVSDLDIALLEDTQGGWPDAARQSLVALGALETGTLNIRERTIRLVGAARTPAEREAAERALGGIPGDFTQDIEITTLDDGLPLAFDITYDAVRGANIAGKLPVDVSLQQVTDILDVSRMEGTPTVGIDGDPVATLSAISVFGDWLPELEAGTFSQREGRTSVTGIASPGVDAALLTGSIQAALGEEAEVNISELAEWPAEATARINAATRNRESFSGGFWLPEERIAPILAICDQRTTQILADNKITFLTGSADLDARASRTINALAAVLRRCLDGSTLKVELGGHTDSRGPEDSNLALSQLRADAVRSALTVRGIPEASITAVGYGEGLPIADNETEEGRAANRRTSISWSN